MHKARDMVGQGWMVLGVDEDEGRGHFGQILIGVG